MAHYKMCVQLRDQSRAFFHGFREFIHRDWLGMFSGPELQKLISGDSTTLDVSDLRYLILINFSYSQRDLSSVNRMYIKLFNKAADSLNFTDC